MARVVYMGTPAFAVPALRSLLEAGHDIAAVVTQPDRPAGRSRLPRHSAVKEFALQHDLPIWQPPSLRSSQAKAYLQSLAPEVVVVAAFGEILPPDLLAIPRHGCLNIHASLLPRHRGPAPVAAAILAGDPVTGVTLMLMDPGMDTGPVLSQQAVPLSGQERCGELSSLLAQVGAGLLMQTLPAWLAGKITPRPQDETQATVHRMLRKEDGEIHWTLPAHIIERMVRAYDPWPGAYTFLQGRRLRIWRATVSPESSPAPEGTVRLKQGKPIVSTGEGSLVLEELQLEGKRRLEAEAFLRGQRDLAGVRLG